MLIACREPGWYRGPDGPSPNGDGPFVLEHNRGIAFQRVATFQEACSFLEGKTARIQGTI